ncbi:hypothetical protein RF11_08039 [Thelohanellus kitauei]|uniref:CCHC-type domain-containing protein n=1 Tax=Thelohanellus kitauei TaxID=669202 RepID=A0A0C2M948_THEKT|nr:hypothetical protein RF11_08039 [Thelohanellus kitauei]
MATSDYTEQFYANLQDFQFDAFNEEIEDWDNYIGRPPNISPRAKALKRDLLISSFTARQFQLLREQVGGDLEALTFQDVCQAMASRYRKKTNPFVERREFYKCVRRPDEDTLNDAVESVALLFSSIGGAKSLANSNQAAVGIISEITAVRKLSRSTASKGVCLRCIRYGYHQKRKIRPAANSTCYLCRKVGHFSRACLSSVNKKQLDKSNLHKPYSRFYLNSLCSKSKPIYVNAIINRKEVEMLSDTGANVSSMDKDISSTLGAPIDDINVKITGCMGNDYRLLVTRA